jgi:hypothetical protein
MPTRQSLPFLPHPSAPPHLVHTLSRLIHAFLTEPNLGIDARGMIVVLEWCSKRLAVQLTTEELFNLSVLICALAEVYNVPVSLIV